MISLWDRISHKKHFELVENNCCMDLWWLPSVAWISKKNYIIHLYEYFLLAAGVTILLVKKIGLIDMFCRLDSILIFNVVLISLSRKNIWHPNELLRTLGGIPCPILLGCVEYIVINCLGIKSELVIFNYGLHSIPYLFSSITYHLDFPISIWWFPVATDLIKFPILYS